MGSSTSSGSPSAFDSFVSAGAFGRKSATAAAMTTTSAPRRVLEHGRLHLGRGLHPDHRRRRGGPGRVVVVTSTTSAPRSAAASARAWPCFPDDRLEMKRTGSIGSRVPPALTTTRRPARSRRPAPRAGRRPSTASARRLDDVGRLGQPPGPDVAPGQPALARRHHVHPAPAQGGQVLLDGGVLPHLGVHGRAHHHRRPGGEHGGGEQPVGDPGGVAAEEAGRGRGHHDQVGASGPDGCGGWGRPRSTGSAAPAPRPGPRTSPRPRTGWRRR